MLVGRASFLFGVAGLPSAKGLLGIVLWGWGRVGESLESLPWLRLARSQEGIKGFAAALSLFLEIAPVTEIRSEAEPWVAREANEFVRYLPLSGAAPNSEGTWDLMAASGLITPEGLVNTLLTRVSCGAENPSEDELGAGTEAWCGGSG